MPWSNQGGGWQGGGGQGPWGGRPGGSGGGGPQPPDLEELLRRGQDRIRKMFPGGGGGGGNFFANKKAIGFVALVAVAVWLASGFYRVQPDEQGVVLTFGALSRVTGPGLNYHLPYPIETVNTPSVERINRVEIGFRSGAGGTGPRAQTARDVPREALMLTGDENIVDINFTVLWRIKDAAAYLFNVRSPDETVKDAAESVMREIIGRNEIAAALAERRQEIAVEGREMLQELLDDYGAGILVTEVELQKADPPAEVIDAFRDVQRAQADRERLQNEAEAFANDILPRARGEAERITQEAEAYRQEVVARSEGEAERFIAVLAEYAQAQEVTLRRLYLETIEDVLRATDKIIIDDHAQGASGVLPYLPLPDLERRQRERAMAVADERRRQEGLPELTPEQRDRQRAAPVAGAQDQRGRFGQLGADVGGRVDRLVTGDR